jgi:hypothetical protein
MTAPEPPSSREPGPDSTSVSTTSRRPSLALVGGLVAIIALAAIIAFAFLNGAFGGTDATPSPSPNPTETDEPSPEPTSSPTPEPTEEPTATPTPTPTPASEARPFRVTWTAGSGIDPMAMVNEVAYLDGRWIAVGAIFDDTPVASIWTSTDGATWTRADIDASPGQNEYTQVSDVAEVDGALVAIGSWGAIDSDQRSWVTWRSTDGGATWTESRDPSGMAAFSRIVGGGPGLVAVGWNVASGTPTSSFFATSADGITWEHTQTVDEATVRALGVVGDRLVAVGHVQAEAGGDRRPAAWYSDDGGVTWTAGTVPEASDLAMADLAPFGDGLAAIGDGGDAATAAWITVAWMTDDGATWEAVEVADGAMAMGIGAVDAGLVGVGNFAAHDIGPGVSWTSADGAAWQESGELADGAVRLSAVAGQGDVVVAGGLCQSEGCETVIWIGEVTR